MSAPAQPSPLRTAITAYLDRKRSLGFKYDNEARILCGLDLFLAEHGHGELTSEGFHGWALTLEPLTPQGRLKKMRIVRNFTLHHRRTAPDCFVPDPSQFPAPAPAPAPWIFTDQQVLALLEQTGRLLSPPHSPLCPHVYRLAVVLLYTAGLRRGELLRLCIGDYDPCRHTLLVRVSKFHKSRLVALSSDAGRELDSYLQLRQCFPCTASSPLLAHGPQADRAYSGTGFGRAMGHVSLASTAYYLSLIGPVLEQAAQRVADHVGSVLTGPAGGRHD
ncbi:MAG: tyrosine-type recombinase/integrase [Acidobacteriia bacterium]|nr:tyrosine-type recombinase/integrase [Terriglobia bacterium]MYK12077.1 tyrosine-type recombinase/integrase [Terriglobia bacterium]